MPHSVDRITSSAPAPEPHVSIVIPTRNRWPTLAECGLRAALTQQGARVEVIVVDDGSDTQPDRVGPLADSRVRLFRHDRRRGVAAARNTGIRRSRGDWIAFLDDDDIWAPDKLVAVISAIEERAADFGYSKVLVVDRRLRPIREVPGPLPDQLLDGLRRRNVLFAGASNVVARVSLIEGAGGFDEAFSAGADWEMWLRLSEFGSAASVDRALVAYRASSWVLDDEPAHREDCMRLLRKHPAVALDWRGYERWVAERLARAGRRREAVQRHLRIATRFRDPRSLIDAMRAAVEGRLLDWVRRIRVGSPPPWLGAYRSET